MKQLALPRNAVPIALVALLHVAAIWALASSNTASTQEPKPMKLDADTALQIAVEIATETKATPLVSVPVPAPMPAPVPKSLVATAIAQATPTATPANAPADESTSSASPASTTTAASASGAGTTPLAPSNTATVQLPSSDADYLNNPKPAYPPMSRRLGEQGTVVVRALIGADGNAQKAEVQQSSGFERLDRAAVETALKWRYLPGKRAGVAEAMWFKVPLRFVLE